jgi:hypothetical protein
MDNHENLTVHLVTNILSNFSGNRACVDSIGKLISPLVTHLPPVTFLYEDCFPTASCNIDCCVGEIYLESQQQKVCSELQQFVWSCNNYECTLSCSQLVCTQNCNNLVCARNCITWSCNREVLQPL